LKIYIAGKITGNANFEQEFEQAERDLRAQGHTPLNPAKLPKGLGYGDYIHIGFAMIDTAEAVMFLDSWRVSRGAKMEFDYALATGKAII